MKKIVPSELKSTGVLRKMDDLGRLIVPRAIRMSAGFKGDDEFEIYVSDGMVCFMKVSDAKSDATNQ